MDRGVQSLTLEDRAAWARLLAISFDRTPDQMEQLLLWFHHLPWDYRMGSGRKLWEELVARYRVKRVGPCEGIEEHFWAIGTERKVQHPLVQRLLRRAD